MLTIFYRRFYILLFLVWLGATAGLFVLSVWGNFGTFVSDFGDIARVESEMTETNSTDVDVVTRTSDTIVHKAQLAKAAVRKEVIREVRVVEKGVDRVFKVTAPAPPDPVVESAVEEKAKALLAESRQHAGPGKLTAMSFTNSPNELIARLTTSKSVDKVTVFWLNNPTRLVVDLRGDWKNVTSRIHRFTDSFMYRVVVGMHPDRLRVVFKFDDPKAPMGERPGLVHTVDGLDIVVLNPGK